jgi:hypothetical protein
VCKNTEIRNRVWMHALMHGHMLPRGWVGHASTTAIFRSIPKCVNTIIPTYGKVDPTTSSIQPHPMAQAFVGPAVYLLIEREFRGFPAPHRVYKVGRTDDIIERMRGYPKGSKLLMYVCVDFGRGSFRSFPCRWHGRWLCHPGCTLPGSHLYHPHPA